MFKINIVTYEGSTGWYQSFNNITFDTQESAVEEATRLRQLTGKCYGVFFGDSEAPCYETSSYFAHFNLKGIQ